MERYPNLNEKVGDSNHECENSSRLGIKLVWWSTASCALTLACWLFVLKIKIKMQWQFMNTFFFGLIPHCEISSLLDKKLARWSTTSLICFDVDMLILCLN